MRNRIFLLLLVLSSCKMAKQNVKVGAYYFDGWTGKYSYHITKKLIDSFPERKPRWGWITSTPSIVKKQAFLARNSGVDFFTFCWYPFVQSRESDEKLNNALSLFQNVKINDFYYSILVINQDGFDVNLNNWKKYSEIWISHFKNRKYLRLQNKPVITFYSIKSLFANFKSTDSLNEAFEYLRAMCRDNKVGEISIGLCTGNSLENISLTKGLKIDFLTGYNYHSIGFRGSSQIVPIDSLTSIEKLFWCNIASQTNLTYMPVATLNWDPRPWAENKNFYSHEKIYTGFSENSVFKSTIGLLEWFERHNQHNNLLERFGMLYAWNEYGEGAWLTPNKLGFKPLKGLKKAIKEYNSSHK